MDGWRGTQLGDCTPHHKNPIQGTMGASSALKNTLLVSGGLIGAVYAIDKGIASRRLKKLPEGKKVLEHKDRGKIAASFLASGIAFGLIDNGGLMLGMTAIEDQVSKYTTDQKVIAGLGNTYSDIMGAFLGAYMGSIIAKKTGWDGSNSPPLWAAAGVAIGCLIPVWFQYNKTK